MVGSLPSWCLFLPGQRLLNNHPANVKKAAVLLITEGRCLVLLGSVISAIVGLTWLWWGRLVSGGDY